MDNYIVGRRILEIITEFEATRIKDSRIFLSEESIKLMVGDDGLVDFEKQFPNCLDRLKSRGLIVLEHKCGERRWRLPRGITK